MLGNSAALIILIAVSALARSREFALYGTVFLLVGGGLWPILRPYPLPWWLLAALEVGVLAHFAGGLAHVGDPPIRLYDTAILGVTFDKYVHAYNAGVGTLAFRRVFVQTGLQLGPRSAPLLAACVALTAGMAIEMVEYLAVLTLPNTGVGGYANNLQDLFANSLGAAIVVAASWPWLDHNASFR